MKKLLIILCLGFAVLYYAYDKITDTIRERENRIESHGLPPLHLRDTGTVRGRAMGRPEFDGNLLFDAIEKANPATENELNEIFAGFSRQYGSLQPLAGAKVTIKGKEIVQETKVDEHGNFSFENLPFGKYVVIVSMPDCAGIYPNTRRTAFDRRSVVVNRKNRDVTLVLEPTVALVTLQGRVYAKDQTPAANVVVTATRIYPRSQDKTRGIRTWETVTDENGNYQFKDIPLQNFFLLSSALLAKGTSLNNFEINAESSQGMRGNPVVLSAITEELCFLAEKWKLFYEKMEKMTGKKAQILPAVDSNDSFSGIHGVEGNVIIVDDIILNCDECENRSCQ